RGNLALAHTKLGESHLQTGKGAGKALEEFRKGLAIREDIRDHPRDKFYSADAARAMVADSYRKLALVATRLGDPVQARKIYLDILQYQQGEGRKSFKDPDDFVHAQAGLYQSLTDVSWRLGDEPAMQDYQDKCLKTRLEFVEKYKFPSVRKELALSYSI